MLENTPMLETHLESDVNQSHVRDFYYIIFRHRKAALRFFVTIMAAATLFALFAAEIYRSEATLLIRLGRENVVLDPTATTGQTISVGGAQNRTNEINSELKIIQSRELAEKVVEALGVDVIQNGFAPVSASEDPSFLGTLWSSVKQQTTSTIAAIRQYLPLLQPAADPNANQQLRNKTIDLVAGNLLAETIKDSNVIALAYDAKTPELAHAVLDRLIDFYLQKHIAVYRSSDSYQFFADQTQGLRDDLMQTSEKLKNLKNETGISSLEEQRAILLERLGAIRTEQNATESARVAIKAEVAALKIKLSSLPPSIVTLETQGAPSSAGEELRKQIFLLQLKKQELLSVYTPEAIPVQELQRQIKEAETLLPKANTPTVARGINQAHQNLSLDIVRQESQLKSLESKSKKLKEQLAQAEEELKQLNGNELQLAELNRDLTIQETNYRKYTESLEQARIDNALEMQKISNISLTQAATKPFEPISPKKGLILIAALFFATVGAFALAFFLEYIDHSFTKPEDIEERLGLQAVATIPKLPRHDQMLRALSESTGYIALPNNESDSPDSSEALSLRSNTHTPAGMFLPVDHDYEMLNKIFFQNSQDTSPVPQTVAITSCHAGEGVSSVALYLATMLHQRFSSRVLLVDAKFNNPSLHEKLSAKLSPGLADILVNKLTYSGVFQQTAKSNLDFLSAGELKNGFLSWPERRTFAKLLQALKQKYDFIIVDTPALWNGSETTNLEALTDGVILVIEAESVRWEVAQRAKNRLQKINANILGVVLNKRCYHIPEWIYCRL